MIKPSTAPDYVYPMPPWLQIGVEVLAVVFFHFDTTTFQYGSKKYLLASFRILPLRIGMSILHRLCLVVFLKKTPMFGHKQVVKGLMG